MHWGFLDSTSDASAERDPFLVGPSYQGNLHFKSKKNAHVYNENNNKGTIGIIERMNASNMSQGIDKNSIIAAISDKKNT